VQLNQFAKDILSGLTSKPKKLSSKYFYDAKGDKLFQEIMNLDEYYLSRAELEIFNNHKSPLLDLINNGSQFEIIELGAGDGEKTKVLLQYFQQEKAKFTYSPVDISDHVLRVLKENMNSYIPDLDIHPLTGDYFQVLQELRFNNEKSRSIVFFLGSNIGNFLDQDVISFVKSIQNNLKKGDLLMIGFDLKKDPRKVLGAYNDKSGITKAFNLNLLSRINEELGADFDLDQFEHYPVYDPMTGQCRSYLLAKKKMEVQIDHLNTKISFEAWEPVFMEVSKKYDLSEIEQLATKTGFSQIRNFFDDQKLFCNSIWEVK